MSAYLLYFYLDSEMEMRMGWLGKMSDPSWNPNFSHGNCGEALCRRLVVTLKLMRPPLTRVIQFSLLILVCFIQGQHMQMGPGGANIPPGHHGGPATSQGMAPFPLSFGTN